MADDPRTDDANTVITVGMLEQVLSSVLYQVLNEALKPIIERLDRLDTDMAALKSDVNSLKAEMVSVQGSLNTIRREGLDMRAAVDGVKADLRHMRSPVPCRVGDDHGENHPAQATRGSDDHAPGSELPAAKGGTGEGARHAGRVLGDRAQRVLPTGRDQAEKPVVAVAQEAQACPGTSSP